jgi:hypothetical protein
VNPSGPPHYQAFRGTLVVAVLVALGVVAWWTAQPEVLRAILIFLNLPVR